ncbi:MAG: SIR2 family protein [Chitinophagales bacterium]
MTNEQWEQLLNAIEQEECILFLGPGVSTIQKEGKELPLTAAFAEELAGILEEKNKEFEAEKVHDLSYIAERFLTLAGTTESYPARLAKDFYEQHAQVTDVHRFLASLPFSMIINTSPDKLIVEAYKEAGKEFVFDYYHFRDTRIRKIDEPERQETVIYNIFGSVENDYKSILVSERDSIKFATKVAQNNPQIPEFIKSKFVKTNPKSYLLVGFDYEKWHLKILFDSFEIKQHSQNHAIYTPETAAFPVSKANQQFFAEALHFHFVDKKMGEFTTELKDLYAETFGLNSEPEPPEHPLKVVLIGAIEDKLMKEELLKYIGILEQNGYIDIWHSGKILASTHIQNTFEARLKEADIVLPLLSSDFFNTDEFFEAIEIAFERQANQSARVVPVVLRSCMWKDTPFKKMPDVLPDGGKPIKSWSWNPKEEAYKNVAEGLKRVVYEILNKKR